MEFLYIISDHNYQTKTLFHLSYFEVESYVGWIHDNYFTLLVANVPSIHPVHLLVAAQAAPSHSRLPPRLIQYL